MKTNRLFTIFIAVFTLLFFVSCKKDTVDMPEITTSLPEKLTDEEANVLYWNSKESKTLSYEDAVTSVEYLVNIFSNDSRSANKRTILNSTVLSSEVVNPLSRSQAQADTAVYLFNFADNGGFVMVSGDIRTDRILCFIEEGNLDPNEAVDNPGFALFLAFAENSLERQKVKADSLTNVLLPDALEKAELMEESQLSSTDKVVSRASYHYEPSSNKVGPLLTVEWNQNSPFNDLVPLANAPAGCVAIAVGQIMAYWEKPASLPWANMKNYRYGPTETIGRQAVAQLIRDIGRGVKMSYAMDGSGAQNEDVPPYLRSVGFNSGDVTAYKLIGQLQDGKVKEQLNLMRPIYMSGYAKKTEKKFLGIVVSTSYQEGHSWVCDGYQEYEMFDMSYRGVITSSDGTTFVDRDLYKGPIIKTNFLHMNWGWGGWKNGYYSATLFDTNAGPMVTRDGTSDYYQYNLTYIPNIY